MRESQAKHFLDQAAEIAQLATCQRAKCGSIIVKDNKIIGIGFNSPPQHLEAQRRCQEDKTKLHRKVSDKTCCIHAEQRAILDALKKHPDKVQGATLYFMRIDKNNKATKAGQPYCTVCSKLALETGIRYFVLEHEKEIKFYNTEEYNLLSYQFKD